jgi:L-asparaginase II
VRLQLDVWVWRGDISESRHRVQAAVCDPDGRLEAATEDPARLTTFRSAAKPFQLLPLVERGHADRWGFGDEQLAVMAASHTGSAAHVALVSGILDRLGLTDRHLACGFHEPLDAASLARVRRGEDTRLALYNNCSGKHAGMLCLALSEGWPVEGYEKAGHPVQQLMRRTVAEMCGLAPEALIVSVDGCSASVFGVPLAAMARAYARLAAARPEGNDRERALHRIRSAMTRHPWAVGGEGRLSTAIMERTGDRAGGRIVAKGGAEGLECVGLPERRAGIAIKCEDGQARAVGPATLAVLEQLGELDGATLERLGEFRRPIVHNHAGLEVGCLEAVVKVLTPAI